MMQVPLFIFKEGPGGFPAFLSNNFAGNSKIQLVHTIQNRKIVQTELFNKMMHCYVNYVNSIGNTTIN